MTKCSPLLEPSLFIKTHWYAAQSSAMLRNFLGMCQLQPSLIPPLSHQCSTTAPWWGTNWQQRARISQRLWRDMSGTGTYFYTSDKLAGNEKWDQINRYCLWLQRRIIFQNNIKEWHGSERKREGELMRGQKMNWWTKRKDKTAAILEAVGNIKNNSLDIYWIIYYVSRMLHRHTHCKKKGCVCLCILSASCLYILLQRKWNANADIKAPLYGGVKCCTHSDMCNIYIFVHFELAPVFACVYNCVYECVCLCVCVCVCVCVFVCFIPVQYVKVCMVHVLCVQCD